MTWQAVARKDFQDAIRSWWLWGLTLVLVFTIGGISLLWGWLLRNEEGVTSDSLFGVFADMGFLGQYSFTGFLGFMLALIAIVTAYSAIIDERESGTLKVLLSLPHSRQDVIAGKLVGRSAVVVAPLLGAFFVVMLMFALTGVSIVFENLIPHILLTVLMAVAFVGLAIGISAWAASTRQATVATFGSYFVLVLLWGPVSEGLPRMYDYVAERLPLIDPMAPETFARVELFITYINPLRLYETLSASIYMGEPIEARLFKVGIFQQAEYCQALGGEVIEVNGAMTCSGSPPFYLQDAFLLLVLIAWIVVPPLVGYLVFDELDL